MDQEGAIGDPADGDVVLLLEGGDDAVAVALVGDVAADVDDQVIRAGFEDAGVLERSNNTEIRLPLYG